MQNRRFGALVLTGVLGIGLAACAAEPGSNGAAEPGTTDGKVIVASPVPAALLTSTFWIANAEGMDEDEDISVEVVTATDPLAAVVAGDVQVGIVNSGAAMQAIDSGLDVRIVSGYLCRSVFQFATAEGIEKPEDLAGKDVAIAGVAGDPAENQRLRVLSEEGWDLKEVGANLVYPGPSSSTWVEFFTAGRVAMTPFFGPEIQQILAADGTPRIQELRAWPNFVQVASTSYIEEHSDELAALLRTQMNVTEFRQTPGLGQQPANKTTILDIYDENGEDTTALRASDNPFAMTPEFYCPNMYFGEEGWDITKDSTELNVKTSFDDAVDFTALSAAQKELGLDNSPPAEITWPAR